MQNLEFSTNFMVEIKDYWSIVSLAKQGFIPEDLN